MSQVTLLRKRHDAITPCDKDLENEDLKIMNAVINEVGCVPSFWKYLLNAAGNIRPCCCSYHLSMDFHPLSSSPSEVKCHTGTKNSYQSLCKPCLNPASPCACANVHKGQWIHNVCITHPLLGPVNGSVRTKVTEYTPHNYPCDGNMVLYISFIFHDCTTDTTKIQYPTNSFKSKSSFVLTMSYSSNIRNK